MPDRADDGSVGNDEVLLRRLLPDWVERDESGRARPKSLAFIDRRSGELSVHRQHLTTEAFVLRKHPAHGIAAFPAGAARTEGFAVVADPIENETNMDDDPSHALVVPPPATSPSKVKTLARKLAHRTDTVVIREPANTNAGAAESGDPEPDPS